MLVPTDHHIGTKRICVDTDYWATFNRDNVTLIDVRHDPIERFTRTGMETRERSFELDTVVFATGYDAMTGALLNIDIRGRRGSRLSDSWRDGPATYLGVAVHGFPNLFLITGPGSPSVRANMITAIEQHVEWIAGCLVHLDANGLTQAEATAEAQSAWVGHVAEVADSTLFGRSSSWYSGDNIEGKPRVFAPYVGGFDVYVRECDEVARDGYRGFTLS
jgi:cyclohexanone monooxygenase